MLIEGLIRHNDEEATPRRYRCLRIIRLEGDGVLPVGLVRVIRENIDATVLINHQAIP